MAGLWDQIGGFFEGVGDIASKITDAGEQVFGAVSTFEGLKSGTSVGVPPTLPTFLPPGYGPLYATPTGNQPNTTSIGTDAITKRIRERDLQQLVIAGAAVAGLVLLLK